jgi:hypothetical protein
MVRIKPAEKLNEQIRLLESKLESTEFEIRYEIQNLKYSMKPANLLKSFFSHLFSFRKPKAVPPRV